MWASNFTRIIRNEHLLLVDTGTGKSNNSAQSVPQSDAQSD